MFLIGTTIQDRVFSQGDFYCPTCRQDVGYRYVRVSKYFHLWFVPLFSMECLGEYIDCSGCGGKYELEVLARTKEYYTSPAPAWECAACKQRTATRDDVCQHCHRWRCENCGRDNAIESRECMRCRSLRGGAVTVF